MTGVDGPVVSVFKELERLTLAFDLDGYAMRSRRTPKGIGDAPAVHVAGRRIVSTRAGPPSCSRISDHSSGGCLGTSVSIFF